MHKALENFEEKGTASFIVGGQAGSEAKGCSAAFVAAELAKEFRRFDIVTTNAGAQAGHTSTHKGIKRVVYHLPTASLIAAQDLGNSGVVYLNAGSIIDPAGLEKELNEQSKLISRVFIHPMAAVITDECREAEMKLDSAQTKIASTRKGVGQALSRKVLRSGVIAKHDPYLKQFVRRIDLNACMLRGDSVLVEVPQGVSLSLNHSPFYPHTTSRDCTVGAGMSDAGIHPTFYNKTMVVIRTYPIRVGAIVEGEVKVGYSGGCYPDQRELTWEELGVEAEITTVTKRVRRVFTYSHQQFLNTFALCRPDIVFLAFCNYAKEKSYLDAIVKSITNSAEINQSRMPDIVYQWGPTTGDIRP